MIVSFLLITLAGTFTSCTALKNGAPTTACSTLLPLHQHSKPQQVSSPYVVSTQSLGDNKIGVTISSPSGETFKGFILQARSASDRNNFTPGEFKADSISQGIKCEGLEQSTLTHVNNEQKAKVSTEWTGSPEEDIIFRATVVKDFTTFWTNIDSDPIAVEKRETDEFKNSTVTETYDCVESKYCLGMPANCVEKGNCTVLLQFKANDDGTIQFSLSGNLGESEYMAMGISEDDIMNDDFVTECVRVDSTGIRLRKSWNEKKKNLYTKDISPSGMFSLINGETRCVWNDPRVLKFNGKTYDLTHKPYILLAHGKVNNDELEYHDSKLVSSQPIDLFASESVDLNENGGDAKQSDESGEKPITEVTSETIHKNGANSCLQLNLSLLCLVFIAAFCASGRNLI